MDNTLIFATNNNHKASEIDHMLENKFKVVTLAQIGIEEDIPETGHTFYENASQKSHYVYQRLKQNCFADDSGLEVKALNNAPGVYSARYSGSRDMDKNIDLLLANMENIADREAAFKTAISLILNGKEYFFEGTIEGALTRDRKGTGGFGYDPIFIPKGYQHTFAEMSPEEKNSISHRSIAVKKLVEFLLSRHF